MKFLIVALILFVGILMPVALSAARFDWVLGQPAVVDDLDNTTHGTRYDWVLGQPTVVREEETAAPAVKDNMTDGDFVCKSNICQFKSGVTQIK